MCESQVVKTTILHRLWTHNGFLRAQAPMFGSYALLAEDDGLYTSPVLKLFGKASFIDILYGKDVLVTTWH